MPTPTHDAAPHADWRPPAGKPSPASRLMRASWRGLPPRRYEAGREAGAPVPGADGSPLLTDHYFPRATGDFPTLLVRSPYGRGLPWAPQFGMLFAEQGFHVVLQSCRGTGGSGGGFDLWRHEAGDGQATVAWLREQPWFNGVLGTIGPSYLGYVQWALALDPPPELQAMVVQMGLHDPHALFHSGGVPQLENTLVCGVGTTHQHQGAWPLAKATLRLRKRLEQITTARPLRGAYAAALGDEPPWLDGVLAHPDADDPHWQGASTGGAADGLTVPTCLIGGWHDALLGQTLEQYARLRRSGCPASLLIGPWTHTSAFQRGWPEVFAESLAWLRAHLCGDPSGLRQRPVRVHTGGADAWREMDDWPAEAPVTPWYPTADGHLTRQAPTDDGPLASFRYDPADPTPSVGGPLLSPEAGPRDNGALEARDDVLTFTGPPLDAPLDLLGPVSARLDVAADTGHAHVFVRLCEVDARGRSRNICDGLARLGTGQDTPARITVPMSATAHRFPAGHRVRLQVSGGAHPRFARSSGTAEPPADAVEFVPVRLTVHADSALLLPQEAGESGDGHELREGRTAGGTADAVG